MGLLTAIRTHVPKHHTAHPDLTLHQLVTHADRYSKTYSTSRRPGDADTRGLAIVPTVEGKAHMVESALELDTVLGDSETAVALALSFYSAP